MGMSASQARLIALTARMNDIEYQGQQINQQRTTLSNQINALYSSLLDMQVPTPPAKSDFTIVEYGGNLDASKFKLGTVTPAGKYPDSDIQLYNIDINYETTGLAMNRETGKVPLKFTPGAKYYPRVDTTEIKNNFYTKKTVIEKTTNSAVDFNNIDDIDGQQDVMLEIDASNFSTLLGKIGLYTMDNDGDFVEILGTSVPDGITKIYAKTNITEIDDADSAGFLKDFLFDENNEYKDGTTAYKTNSTPVDKYVANENANLSGYYVVDNGVIRQLTLDDLKSVKNGVYPEIYSSPVLNEADAGSGHYKETLGDGKDILTVGTSGTIVYDANSDEAKAQLDSVENCRTALMNSFPKIAQNLANNEDILDKFYVYFEITQSGKPKPHFIIKSDIETQLNSNTLNANTYEFDEDGKYTDSQEKKGCRLEFDSSGRITQIGIPVNDGEGNILNWTWVKLTMTESTDNDAYEDAFNEYEYKKYLYDKEQQAINAKTSIIQSEDKNLELKLTRLDNERNAVKTEIDAVKKVVDDNIEKSFKTFSG